MVQWYTLHLTDLGQTRFIIEFYNYFPIGLDAINGMNINPPTVMEDHFNTYKYCMMYLFNKSINLAIYPVINEKLLGGHGKNLLVHKSSVFVFGTGYIFI